MTFFRSFQNKLFITYSLLIVLLTALLSIPMYIYLKNDIEHNINLSVEQVVKGVDNNINLVANEFESITKQFYLSKDSEGLPAIQYLIQGADDALNALKTEKAIDNLIAISAEINRNLYRVTVISARGDVFSSRTVANNERLPMKSPLLDSARKANGAAVLLYQENGSWVQGDQTPIFSLIRLLKQGEVEIGFLEIQVKANDLIRPETFPILPQSALTIFNQTGILYPHENEKNSAKDAKLYRDKIGNLPFGNMIIDHDKVKEVIIFLTSAKLGYSIVYSVPSTRIFAPLHIFRNVTFLALFLLVAFSLCVFYWLSRTLTLPLRKLKKVIDSVDLHGKKIKMDNKLKMDEIEILNLSFRNMNERLQSSLEEIVQFRTIQLQSHFETLQAQINPHFLFNMLGVTSFLADEKGITDVGDICRKLADFLKYSISTNNPITTIENELQYAVHYLELMGYRHLHRLQFEIAVPDEMNLIPLPKLTLQPLIENSLQHGFIGINRGMKIKVSGQITANQWILTVQDNGNGFKKDTLVDLHKKIEHYQETIGTNKKSDQLLLGGMGLINTFARLKLTGKEQVAFKIGNNEGEGAFISISGYLNNMD